MATTQATNPLSERQNPLKAPRRWGKLTAAEALLRRAMEGLTGMDFYSDRRALAAEIAAALGGTTDE